MSHKKAWKEFSYIKNDQQRDSQSEISESRSLRSYHFNKVKFSKSKENIQTSMKKFGLANLTKLKDHSRENSLINDSMIKKQQTSFINKMQRPSLQLSMKSPKNNNKPSTKIQKYLYQMRKIHDSLKNMTENLLACFEKIKDQLENNLLKVIDQVIKVGKSNKLQDQIHQIVHKSFSEMKKSVSILPCSLTQLSNSREEEPLKKDRLDIQIPSSPLLKPIDLPIASKSKPRITSIFTPKQHKQQSGEFIFELPISSSQKVRQRPQTQRNSRTRFASFANDIPVREFRENFLSKRSIERPKNQTLDLQKPNNIENIICQMRSILNQ